MEPDKKSNTALIAMIVVVLLAAVAAGAVFVMNNPTPKSNVGDSSSSDFTPTTGTYKDGSYTATGSYDNPGGSASLDLTVDIKDGKIASTSLVKHPSAGASAQFQAEFADNYESLVVGKSVNEVHLTRVAGSSLTSGGFNAALEQIKEDAKA